MNSRIRHYRIHLYPYAMNDVPYLHGPFVGSSPLPAVYARSTRKVRPRLRKIFLVPLYPAAYDRIEKFRGKIMK